MACDSCTSDRIISLNAKCADRCYATYQGVSKSDYAPKIPNVSGGDYVNLSICLECGKTQGSFPVEDPEGFERLACIECEEEANMRNDPYEGQPCSSCQSGYYMPI